MIARPDGLKVSSTERVCFRIGSPESYTVSGDSVRTRLLNGNKSAWLIDSEIEVASSGYGYGKGCKTSGLEKTHIEWVKERLDSTAEQESRMRLN